MGIITDRNEVLAIYKEAREKRWVLPCFCTENLTTTEAILSATKDYGKLLGIDDLPVIIAITCRYSHRSQATWYTNTRRWDMGLKLFMAEIGVLTGKGAEFEDLRVMVHLDHVQFDDDAELLSWDMSKFSSIMFDASKLPLDDNIALTKQYVLAHCGEIVIEGACDEITDATGDEHNAPTTAEKAEKYLSGTGADMIVANLGTEHRASAGELVYRGDMAKKIKQRIGERIVLHGASSVPPEQIGSLIDDGVCKVNLWTALERDSSPALLEDMLRNASRVAGSATAKRLQAEGLLGEGCDTSSRASLDYFTTAYRQEIVFMQMKAIITTYLKLWYK